MNWSKNMLKNPTAETTADWDVVSGTFTTVEEGYIGTHCFQLVNGEVKQTIQGFRTRPPYILVEIAYIPFIEADIDTVLLEDTQDLKIEVEYSEDLVEHHKLPLRTEATL